MLQKQLFPSSSSILGAAFLAIILQPASADFSLVMRDLTGGSDGNPNNTTEAEAIMALGSTNGTYIYTDYPQVPDPARIDVAGGGNFGGTNLLPNGLNRDNTYVLKATANIIIPAGNWTIGFGSDDGGSLKIPGVTFSNRISNSGSFAANEVRYEGTRGHRWTFGQISLGGPLETSLEAIMFESGGGDSWEIAICPTHTTSFDSDSWSLLANGVHGWTVQVEPLNDPNPPVLSSSIPADNAINRWGGSNLVATFDEEIVLTGAGTITVEEIGVGSDGSSDFTINLASLPDSDAAVSASGSVLTIDPTVDLEDDTEYEVTISSGALEDTWDDPAPNVYGGTASGEWTFRTAPYDSVPPDVVPEQDLPYFPIPGTTDVDLTFGEPIEAPSVAFNKPIVLGTGSIILRNLTRGEDTVIPTSDTDQLIVSDFFGEEDLLTILPAEPLDAASDYAVIIEDTAVRNRSGVAFPGISDPTVWYFQTAIVTVYSPTGSGTTTADSWSVFDNWTVAVPRDDINVEIFATKRATSDGGLADPFTGDLVLGSASVLQIGYQSPRYQEDFNALGTPGETTIFMLGDSELRFRAGNNNGSAATTIPAIELLGDALITLNEGSEPAEDFDFAYGIDGPHRIDLKGNGNQDALLTTPNTFSELVASGNGGTFDVFAQTAGALGGNVTIKSYNGGPAADLIIAAADAISDSAAVALNGDTGSTLITMNAGDSVGTLTINNFPYPAGTYGRVGTPASVDNEVTWIAGNSVLTVLTDTGGSGDPTFLEITDNTSNGEIFISNDPKITYTLEFDNPGTFTGSTGDFFSLGSATVTINSVTQISDQEVEVVVTASTTGTINLQTTGATSFDDLFEGTLNGPFVDDTTITVRDITQVAGELGIIDLTRNGGINPATGALWRIGDTYRFVFCSSTGSTATSSNITTYNNFVQNLANASPVGIGATEGVTWKAIASTPSIAAKDNASLDPFGTGTSLWLVDGTTLVADDEADLFGDGTMNIAIGKSETGGQPLYAGRYRDVWTGSDTSGNIKSNDALGASDSTSKGGLITNWRRGWIDRFTINQNELRPLYGISNVLTVVSTLTPAPEIAVKQGFTDLTSGSSSYEFGTFELNTDNDLVFTLYNFGDAPLNLTGSPNLVAVTGDPDFSVTVQPATNPVPTITGSTTFTIRFKPQAVGSRNATISIANDDSDEALFTFTVTGTGEQSSGFAAWATGGQTFDGDANGDGVKDGIAFLLGAATPGTDATGLLPTASRDAGGNLVLDFTMLNAANRGSATLQTQHSSDMGATDAWNASGNQALVPDVGGTVNGVVFDITAGDPLNTVKATIPSSEANGGGRLFGRLLATE